MVHKTQVLPFLPKHARLLKHRRNVGGSFGVVQDVFLREEEPWVVLALPTGINVAVPASWTDVPPASFSKTKNLPEVSATSLAELARFCRTLRKTPPPKITKRSRTSCKRTR
jgi:hypothetical protein